jgi:NarL family two-component system response regulator LiaR
VRDLSKEHASLSTDPSVTRRTAVILDRYPLWHEAVELVLARIGVELEGKASSPDVALSLVEQRRPNLLVSEIDFGEGFDGIAWLKKALELDSGLRVVVLSIRHEPEAIEQALDAGAAAYVVKTAHPDDLASAIRQAFQNSVYLPATRNDVEIPRPARDAVGAAELTRRELEILQLVAEGHSNAELGRMLWVTEQTVKFHLSKIYRKLGVSNRTEAGRWAQLHGLLGVSARRNGS